MPNVNSYRSSFFHHKREKWKMTQIINVPHLIFILSLEYFQIFSGQTFSRTLADILFFVSIILILNRFSFYPIIAFVLFCYEIFETMSWIYTESGISFRALDSLDFTYALKSMPENIMRLAYWCIVIFGFSCSEFLVFRFRISIYEYFLLVFISLILLFPFASDKYNTLYPFRISGLISKGSFEKILRSFNSKKFASFETSAKKNLIMIEIESFETKGLGKYNAQFPKSMPFLSNLSNHVLHFSKIPSQPYTTWSAAGMFAALCGFPLVLSNVDWSVRGYENFELWNNLPCIPDYLNMLGYKQKAFCSGSCDIMNMKNFMINHNFDAYDSMEHMIDHDLPLLDYILDRVLPDLMKNQNQPFTLFILNSDTHPEFYLDNKCSGSNADMNIKDYPRLFQSFSCFDWMLKMFLQRLEKMGINGNNTEFVIYGDHLTMGDMTYAYGNDRTLSLFFPYRQKNTDIEEKRVTYYDIAPTVLEMLGIHYNPVFPFGQSIFSQVEGNPPTIDDFKFMYNYLTGDITYKNVNCHMQKGFCMGNEY